ncbi:hypothetical protein RIF29_41181 [Crotalaria pallida]|uniref:Uncharacterized protein n=1 Tax=Crotalaria pallida TaxID=3830 RepID=A0AAN9HSE7_CROPI
MLCIAIAIIEKATKAKTREQSVIIQLQQSFLFLHSQLKYLTFFCFYSLPLFLLQPFKRLYKSVFMR